MQLTTFISVASAVVATASADSLRSAVTLNKDCDTNQPHARIVNRCDYDVNLWSVYKGDGCPSSGMVTLKTGESYAENYATAEDGKTGVSIKISKTQQCKGVDITQLEYFLQTSGEYSNNYLDVSYVDCEGEECPTRQEGYYLVAGDQTGKFKAASENTWCPVLSCHDVASCNKCSYVLPDDVQTKTCQLNASINFYMCGSEAPNGDDSSSPSKPKPKPSSSASPSSSPSPSKPESSSSPSATSTKKDAYAYAAAVTPSPSPTPSPTSQLIKTEVVYVTEYVNAKRHAHDHARRHQAFRA